MPGLKLLTDEAVKDKESDGLGFSRYAEILGDAAIGTDGPFTIGIFGEWGTGKTSLMRLVKSHLDDQTEKPVVTVWFNAWQYEKEEHLVIPLIATMLRELEKKKSAWDKLGAGVGKLVDGLYSAVCGLSLGGKIGVPGFGEATASLDLGAVSDELKSRARDTLLDGSIYFGAFERLDSVSSEAKLKIVVIIDDLDRCLPDSAVRLLENIKLLFSQKGFIFVIGVARKIIEGYLTHRYKADFGIDGFHGHSYLDKIVQLPFHLPSHRAQMDGYRSKIISRLDASVQKIVEEIFPIVVMASDDNPRAIIRFINNILIDAAIQKSLAGLNKDLPEIPLSCFAVTRCLQSEWSGMFDILMDSDELCLEMSGWTKEGLSGMADPEIRNAGAVLDKLRQDRSFRKLFFSEEGKTWLREEKLRHATVDFLRKERDDFVPESGPPVPVALIYTARDKDAAAQMARHLSAMDAPVIDINTSLPENRDYKTSLIKDIDHGEKIVFAGSLKHPTWVSRLLSDDLRFSVRSGCITLLMPGINRERAVHLRDKHGRSVFDMTKGMDPDVIREVVDLLKWKINSR